MWIATQIASVAICVAIFRRSVRVGAAVAGAKPLVLRQGSHGAPWQLLEHLTVPSVDGGQREREKRLKKASLLTFFEFSTSSSHLVNCALFRSDAKQRPEM